MTQEKRTAAVGFKLTPSLFKTLALKAEEDDREPGQLARKIFEEALPIYVEAGNFTAFKQRLAQLQIHRNESTIPHASTPDTTSSDSNGAEKVKPDQVTGPGDTHHARAERARQEARKLRKKSKTGTDEGEG